MPWGLKRFQQSHQLHFVTFSCYRRRANFVNAEAVGGAHSGLAREGSVLAGAILRLQCVEREEIRGEAAIYSPQPGGPWTGEEARRLALEQLPPLFDGRGGNGGDRIAMDGAAEGEDGNLPEGAGALEMKTPPKQSLDWAPERVRVGQPPYRFSDCGSPSLAYGTGSGVTDQSAVSHRP